MTKQLTKEQVNKKYKDKYVDVYPYYDYSTQRTMYEVRKVYQSIHENTTLGQDVGTEMEYRRQKGLDDENDYYYN